MLGLGFGAVDWSSVATLVGISPDILKLLALLLLSTPLAVPFASLSAPSIHLYSILCSTYFLLAVFHLHAGLLQLLGVSLATWLTLRQALARPEPISPKIPWLIFFGLLAHLTVNHARRIFWNIPLDTVEITGAQMVLVMKLSMFAWNVYDGQQPAERLDSYQRTTAIPSLPSLLDFLGYCFFFPSLLVGPAIPFKQYAFFAAGRDACLPLPPGRTRRALKKIAIGLAFAGLVGIFGGRWSYEQVLEDAFLRKGWLGRLWHLQVAGLMARGKYYLVWSLSEAAFAMAGCGYDAQARDWTGGRNIDILAIELAQNYKGVFDHWNMKTNVWLRECVYKRVAGDGRPGFGATMATFGASAAWHGPLAAYFLAFLSAGLLQALGRSVRGAIRPWFVGGAGTKRLYDWLCLVGTQTSLNYLVVPFVLLDIKRTWVVYSRLGWYGHILAGVPMLALWGFGLEKRLRAMASASQHPRAAGTGASGKPAVVTDRNKNATLVAAAQTLDGGQKVVAAITTTTSTVGGQKKNL